MLSDLITAIKEAVREWKRLRNLREYRASLKNDPDLPF